MTIGSQGAVRDNADLQQGILMHQRGEFVEAERLYRGILSNDPNDFDAQHLLGVVLHQQGRDREALEMLSAALKIRPDEVVALSNCAATLCALERFDEALALLDRAIALRPEFAQTFYNRGTVLQALTRYEGALTSFDQAIALRPSFAEAHNNRGITLLGLKRFDEVLATYDKAIALKPDFAEALNNRGNVLKELNRFGEALSDYEKAIAIRSDYFEAFNNRGNVLRELKRYDAALDSFGRAIALKPTFAEAHNNLGNVQKELGRLTEAVQSYDQALALRPDFAEAHNNRGNVLGELGHYDEALMSYDRAIALDPNNSEAFNNRATAFVELGRLAEAQLAAQHAIRLAPRKATYHRALGNLARYVAGDPRLSALEELAHNRHQLATDDRIELHFALAKAYDDLGMSEKSFDQLLAGNSLKRRQIAYDESGNLTRMDRARAAFTREFIQSHHGAGDTSSRPIFIIGMPRSGSTLVEQILASHSRVFGGGELRDFRDAVEESISRLDGLAHSPTTLLTAKDEDFRLLGRCYLNKISHLSADAARITDKMTGNFNLAGLIHLTLPNAAIIHTLRDPIDTCISCFSKLFGDGQLQYTYDLAELGRYYRHYQQLMAHWHRVLPAGRILDVRYEEVVGDLEGQARRIVAHCGLDWEPGCLAFHRITRPIRTLSAAQVRQPIYDTSIGRGHAYKALLRPLLTEMHGT
jgi:tetratricopeptide (TPR) repeat protein